MKRYIGTKIIHARPMSRLDYNVFKGWPMPANENGADEGYLVRYEDGYLSWSPKTTFDAAYRVADGVPFGLAIEAVKKGAKIERAGWNGKGMFVYYVPAAAYPAQTGVAKSYFGVGAHVPYNAYLALKTADDAVSTWVPSISDVLAEDWVIVE
jgi:hypothetical protein